MKNLFYLNKSILLFLVAATSCFTAKAQFGSNISYKAIDSVNYEVSLTVYRDCNGSPSSSVATIEVFGKSSGPFKATFDKFSTKDITGINPKCPQKSRCSGTYAYGIQEIIYKDTVNVSGGSCSYEFRYSNCCRPSSITTGQANTNHFNTATVNKCFGLNTSAQVSRPRILIGVEQDFKGKIFVGDTVNTQDSIGYSLVSALSNPTSPANYSGAYDPTKPITFLGFPNKSLSLPAGIHFNRRTSDLEFRPVIANQVAVFCIEAREYRKVNGLMRVVGISRIEYVNIVINVPNNKMPTISGKSSVVACADKPISIEVETSDLDKKDTTTLNIQGLPQGATVSYSSKGSYATATILWTPKKSDIRNTPYTFTASVTDDACPLSGTASKGFSITVRESPTANDVKITSKTVKCSSAEIIIDINSKIKSPIISMVDEDSISFAGNDTSRLYFKGSGWKKFFVKVQNQNFCDVELVDSVFINPSYNLQLNTKSDSSICPNTNITFFSNPINGTAPYNYLWRERFAKKVLATSSSFSELADTLAISTNVLVSDANECIGIDTVNISVYKPTIIKVAKDEIESCPNSPFQLSANFVSGVNIAKYEWLGIDTLQTVTTQSAAPQTYIVEATTKDGCKVIDSTQLKLFSIGVSAGSYPLACKNTSLQLVANYISGYKPIKYEWLSGGIKNDSAIVNVKNNDTSFVIRIEDARGCITYDTARVIVSPSATYQLPVNPTTCAGVPINIKLSNIQGLAPFTFTWDGKASTDSSNTFTLQQTKNIVVDIIDDNNCKVSENINLTVNSNPEPRLGNDKKECKGTVKTLGAFVVKGTKPFNYLWTDGSTNDSFTTTINTVTKIGLRVTDINGCIGIDSVTFDTVQSQSAILTPLNNPFCESDAPVSLKSVPNNGTWTGAGVNGKIFNPNTAGGGVHPLTFSFTSIYNCPERGDIYAIVKQIPQPDFAVDKTKGILNTQFNFTNQTTADTTYTNEWSMGDGSTLLTSQNPSYTYNKVGKYTVTLKVDNGVCSPQTIQKSAYIEVDSVFTSVFELEKEGIRVYPNPVTEILFLESIKPIKAITLFDILGKKVIQQQTNTLITEINVSTLDRGVYTLNILLENGVNKTIKLVVK